MTRTMSGTIGEREMTHSGVNDLLLGNLSEATIALDINEITKDGYIRLSI
jgi:hypothetical protein